MYIRGGGEKIYEFNDNVYENYCPLQIAILINTTIYVTTTISCRRNEHAYFCEGEPNCIFWDMPADTPKTARVYGIQIIKEKDGSSAGLYTPYIIDVDNISNFLY